MASIDPFSPHVSLGFNAFFDPVTPFPLEKMDAHICPRESVECARIVSRTTMGYTDRGDPHAPNEGLKTLSPHESAVDERTHCRVTSPFAGSQTCK